MKLRITIQDVDGIVVATKEFELDEYTRRLLGENVNSQCCGTIRVHLIHEEHLTDVIVPPGIRPH